MPRAPRGVHLRARYHAPMDRTPDDRSQSTRRTVGNGLDYATIHLLKAMRLLGADHRREPRRPSLDHPSGFRWA